MYCVYSVVPVFFFVLSRPGGFLDGIIVLTQILYIRLQITEATQPAESGRGRCVRNPSGKVYIICRVMGTRVLLYVYCFERQVREYAIIFFVGYCPGPRNNNTIILYNARRRGYSKIIINMVISPLPPFYQFSIHICTYIYIIVVYTLQVICVICDIVKHYYIGRRGRR